MHNGAVQNMEMGLKFLVCFFSHQEVRLESISNKNLSSHFSLVGFRIITENVPIETFVNLIVLSSSLPLYMPLWIVILFFPSHARSHSIRLSTSIRWHGGPFTHGQRLAAAQRSDCGWISKFAFFPPPCGHQSGPLCTPHAGRHRSDRAAATAAPAPPPAPVGRDYDGNALGRSRGGIHLGNHRGRRLQRSRRRRRSQRQHQQWRWLHNKLAPD